MDMDISMKYWIWTWINPSWIIMDLYAVEQYPWIFVIPKHGCKGKQSMYMKRD